MHNYLLMAKLRTAQRPDCIVSVKTPIMALNGQQAVTKGLDLLRIDYGADAKLYAMSITQMRGK